LSVTATTDGVRRLPSAFVIAAGFDADLVLLDDDLRVSATFRQGRALYMRSPGNGG
jgi:hypothetical protein